MEPWNKKELIYVVLILVLSSFLYLWALGERDLWATQEARASEIAREMIETGDYICPKISGELETQKPALYYWAVALCSIFSGVTEFTTRFPSALSAIGVIIWTYLLGRVLFGSRVAISAPLILATSVTFWYTGRLARVDMMLTFFVMSAISSFLLLYYTARFKWPLLLSGYISCALACLTKGPIGIVIPFLVIATFLAYETRLRPKKLWKETLRFHPILGFLLIMVIALPWYLKIHWETNGEFTRVFICKHHFYRFTCGDGVFRARPLWFYFFRLLGDFLPWSLFIPAAVLTSWRSQKDELKSRLVSLTIWVVAIFTFFSVVAFKRKEYILSIYPPLSILIASLFFIQKNRWLKITNGFFLSLMTLFVIISFFVFTTPLFEYMLGVPAIKRYTDADSHKAIQLLQEFFSHHKLILGSGLIFAIAAIVIIFIAIKFNRPELALSVITIFVVIGFTIYMEVVLPKIDQFNTLKPFAEKVNQIVPDKAKLIFFRFESHPIVFYAHRHIPVILKFEDLLEYFKQTGPVFFIIDEEVFMGIAWEKLYRCSVIAENGEDKSEKIFLLKRAER